MVLRTFGVSGSESSPVVSKSSLEDFSQQPQQLSLQDLQVHDVINFWMVSDVQQQQYVSISAADMFLQTRTRQEKEMRASVNTDTPTAR